jgi:hypothetical protein
MKKFGRTLLICGLLMLGACDGGGDAAEDEYQYFEFEATAGERFVAGTSDPELIRAARSQLALPESERELFINGEIARGTRRNEGWSWHFTPNKWQLTELSAEVCDGRPSHVEEDLDYWVEEVGRFCPWSSFVLREVER